MSTLYAIKIKPKTVSISYDLFGKKKEWVKEGYDSYVTIDDRSQYSTRERANQSVLNEWEEIVKI